MGLDCGGGGGGGVGAPEQVLTIAPADWGGVLASILAPCFTVPGALAAVGAQVADGRAVAFTADDGGGIVGAFVLRVEECEGVIVAAAGELHGVSLVPLLLPYIEQKFIGCRAIRFHTARPGLARVMQGRGYKGQEIIMRKEIL